MSDIKRFRTTGGVVSEIQGSSVGLEKGLQNLIERYLELRFTRKALKFYIAFRRIKNFACVEVHPQARKLLAYLKVDPDSVELIPGFSRDVRKIGHFGTGDLELTLTEMADLERAKPLILSS